MRGMRKVDAVEWAKKFAASSKREQVVFKIPDNPKESDYNFVERGMLFPIGDSRVTAVAFVKPTGEVVVLCPPKWDPDMEKSFREEFERRFKERTPPRDISEVNLSSRVVYSEMAAWAEDKFWCTPDRFSEEWAGSFAKFVRGVIKKYTSKTYREKWSEQSNG